MKQRTIDTPAVAGLVARLARVRELASVPEDRRWRDYPAGFKSDLSLVTELAKIARALHALDGHAATLGLSNRIAMCPSDAGSLGGVIDAVRTAILDYVTGTTAPRRWVMARAARASAAGA